MILLLVLYGLIGFVFICFVYKKEYKSNFDELNCKIFCESLTHNIIERLESL